MERRLVGWRSRQDSQRVNVSRDADWIFASGSCDFVTAVQDLKNFKCMEKMCLPRGLRGHIMYLPFWHFLQKDAIPEHPDKRPT